ncbi:hypothetical protein RR46_14123 [Papilio xuthus]|uniref:Uncharacterized protein n=1 Tax=Papilio xuthus TaxID=66420 RepID=A0A194PHW0_PAPXU|nr:hypothetical protein RR46_14123 [Papilio xuthus]
METLVLIPQELSLALRPGGARGREASVSVWTSTELQRGSLLYPFQGTIRIDKLHVYSYVADHDPFIELATEKHYKTIELAEALLTLILYEVK